MSDILDTIDYWVEFMNGINDGNITPENSPFGPDIHTKILDIIKSVKKNNPDFTPEQINVESTLAIQEVLDIVTDNKEKYKEKS